MSPVLFALCRHSTQYHLHLHKQLVCDHVAQRKGVLDLYGEQALKAGMAESEPGVAAYPNSYSHACMLQWTPQLSLHPSTDNCVQQALDGLDTLLMLSLVRNRSFPNSLAQPTHMRH